MKKITWSNPSNNHLSNYGQTLLRKVHIVCVSNKKFSIMFIYRSSSEFAKTKRRCYEKNNIFQSHHFIKITTKQKKMLKTSCKLFTTSNHNSHNNCDANHNIMIVCRNFLLNIAIFSKTSQFHLKMSQLGIHSLLLFYSQCSI